MADTRILNTPGRAWMWESSFFPKEKRLVVLNLQLILSSYLRQRMNILALSSVDHPHLPYPPRCLHRCIPRLNS